MAKNTMLKKSELIALAAHTEHINQYEKLIGVLDKDDSVVKVTHNYETNEVKGSDEFLAEIKECLRSFLVDRKVELLRELESKDIDVHQ